MMPARVLVTLNSVEIDGRLAHQVREQHLRALRAAGLLPVLAPGTLEPGELDALLDMCTAAYLPGGDYVPARLDEPEAQSASSAREAGLAWDPLKVRADLHVLRRAWERAMPTLGVCGGFQAMVIADGGTLRACTGDELPLHADRAAAEPLVLQGPLMRDVFPGGCAANSFHRQTVERLGGELVAAASSGDALVEAVEPRTDRDLFWLGLQWHPELLDDLRPYRALARAAERYLCL
jgi:putative glutamine amidotransferase